MVGRKNKKPFVAPAGWQKRRKVENPPRYHSSLFPVLETHSTGYHHIPATVTGAPVCIYFQFDAAAVQPVRQLDRAVPRTNRHFSERAFSLTVPCPCVYGQIVAPQTQIRQDCGLNKKFTSNASKFCRNEQILRFRPAIPCSCTPRRDRDYREGKTRQRGRICGRTSCTDHPRTSLRTPSRAGSSRMPE